VSHLQLAQVCCDEHSGAHARTWAVPLDAVRRRVATRGHGSVQRRALSCVALKERSD
jgi:hypothetical protein